MSREKDEAIADICEEMREHAKDGNFVNGYEVGQLADRIEAAARRETHWDDSETLKNAIAENADLKARLRAIKSMLDRDGFITDDDVFVNWFDCIGESEVAK